MRNVGCVLKKCWLCGVFMWLYSWTSNMNLFENDLVLFPMHVDFSHWVLAVADFRSKTITSYDRWCPLTLYP